MKPWWISGALVLALGSFAAAQTTTNTTTTTTTQQTTPQGTAVQKSETQTVVTPTLKPVKVTPAVVRSAQHELDRRGYAAGPADGVLGPKTRAAIRAFQQHENLAVTGALDENTLSKLNVGGSNVVASAPSALGRGGKALGHDIKGGHPVAGAKAMGKGAEGFGKRVGKGSKAVAEHGAEKVGQGLSAVGNKIEGKTEGKKTQTNTPPQQ